MSRSDASLNPSVCHDYGCDGHGTQEFLGSDEGLCDEVCTLGGFGGELDSQFRHGLQTYALAEPRKYGRNDKGGTLITSSPNVTCVVIILIVFGSLVLILPL